MRMVGIDLALTTAHKAVVADAQGNVLTPVLTVRATPSDLERQKLNGPCLQIAGHIVPNVDRGDAVISGRTEKRHTRPPTVKRHQRDVTQS